MTLISPKNPVQYRVLAYINWIRKCLDLSPVDGFVRGNNTDFEKDFFTATIRYGLADVHGEQVTEDTPREDSPFHIHTNTTELWVEVTDSIQRIEFKHPLDICQYLKKVDDGYVPELIEPKKVRRVRPKNKTQEEVLAYCNRIRKMLDGAPVKTFVAGRLGWDSENVLARTIGGRVSVSYSHTYYELLIPKGYTVDRYLPNPKKIQDFLDRYNRLSYPELITKDE